MDINKRHIIVIGIGIVACVALTTSIALLNYIPETPRFPQLHNHIDLIGNPHLVDEMPYDAIYVDPSSNEYADIALLSSHAQTINISAQEDVNGTYILKNKISAQGEFGIYLSITDDAVLAVRYDASNSALQFVVPEMRIVVNGRAYTTSPSVVSTIKQVKPDARVLVGNNLSTRVKDINSHSFFVAMRDISDETIFILDETVHNALVDNPSFENGLWTPYVADCNKHASGNPENMEMYTTTDATDGNLSLTLSSRNHPACTNKTYQINAAKDQTYVYSFDYKIKDGNYGQYYYKLWNHATSTQHAEMLVATSSTWQSYTSIINPQTFENLDLYFYAPTLQQSTSTVSYDNISLTSYTSRKLNTYSAKTLVYLQARAKIDLGDNVLSSDLNQSNILDTKSSSFEDGMWTQTAEDCNNKAPGNPELRMELVQEEGSAEQMLELSSSNHLACTHKMFVVNLLPDREYQLSLDFKIINGDEGGWYYNLVGDGISLTKAGKINTVIKNTWQTKILDLARFTSAVRGINIYLYAPSSGMSTVIRYDNVLLYPHEYVNLSHLYVQHTQSDLVPEVSDRSWLEFNTHGLFQRDIILHAVSRPMLLTSPEPFDKNAKAYIYTKTYSPEMALSQCGDTSCKNTKLHLRSSSHFAEIDGSLHYNVNNFKNGWFIDPRVLCKTVDSCTTNPDGSYNIALTIKYGPQRWFYLGLLISGTTLLGCIGFLVYDFVYRKRRNKIQKTLNLSNK